MEKIILNGVKKTIDIIELTCRLANERIEELVESNEYSYDDIYLESQWEMKYTKLGQLKFHEYYDFYLSVINDCEIKK